MQVRDELAQADIAFGPILEEARLELHASREQTLEGAAARDALGESWKRAISSSRREQPRFSSSKRRSGN